MSPTDEPCLDCMAELVSFGATHCIKHSTMVPNAGPGEANYYCRDCEKIFVDRYTNDQKDPVECPFCHDRVMWVIE